MVEKDITFKGADDGICPDESKFIIGITVSEGIDGDASLNQGQLR